MNFEQCGTFGNIFYFLFVPIPKGPAKNAQVVMIRSITEDWIYPFFVDWDMSIGVEEFNLLICKAYEEEFTVVVSTCDQGGKNEGLRNKLEITPKKPFCMIKVKNDKEIKVFFLHDWVHIFKV